MWAWGYRPVIKSAEINGVTPVGETSAAGTSIRSPNTRGWSRRLAFRQAERTSLS
jgi:hypothetical protein